VHANLKRPQEVTMISKKMTGPNKIFSEVSSVPSKRHGFIERLVTITSCN
jgi:hypothetical protein